MNSIDARAKPFQGQYIGQFRRIHKARYETVQVNGEAALFPSPSEAECAAWRALVECEHLTSLMRRDGCTVAGNARAAAERLFTRNAHGKSKDESPKARAPQEDGSEGAERAPAA